MSLLWQNLGERVSTGAWIYALGNGLRPEFKECKDGILYNKDGFNNVVSVKTKLLSEEAVLISKSKRDNPASTATGKEADDEIALASLELKEKKQKDSTPKTSNDSNETALFTKGKGGKGHPKGKGNPKGNQRWRAPDPSWENTWNDWDQTAHNATPQHDPGTWTQPSQGKGKGKGKSATDPNKRFDAQTLWCDIHQKYGHSTDWCFDNPNRTGGPPPNTDGSWCDTCNRPGHTSASCFATTIRIPSKGKGKRQKSGKGDRNWKSQNFPAGYNSDQATPALHEESSSSATVSWWNEQELGSAIIDDVPNPVPLHPSLLDDYIANNAYDERDDECISDYIDLTLFAIVQTMERQREYLSNPSNALRNEIAIHSASITRAENCLNIHIQRIIRDFKNSIRYDESMSDTLLANRTENENDGLNQSKESATDELKATVHAEEDDIAKRTPTTDRTNLG